MGWPTHLPLVGGGGVTIMSKMTSIDSWGGGVSD